MFQKIKNFFVAIGGYLLAAAAFVIWLVSILRAGDEVRDDFGERTEAEKVTADSERKSAESRQKRAENAEKKRGKFIVPLFILIALCAGFGVRAAGELFIPDNYPELREYYIDLWDLCEEYRSLYLEAEASVKNLQESNDRLQKIISDQQAYIESLKRARFGAFGGLTWSPSGTGLIIGGTIQF